MRQQEKTVQADTINDAATMYRDTVNDVATKVFDGGQMLAGRFRIVKPLGQGGMGSVWLVEDTLLDGKRFAVKMLPSVLASNKRAYRQLKDEALVAMKLTHPNIVTIRAFEENEGNPFLVMDYVEGQTLDEYIAEHATGRGGLPESEALRILKPVASALDYAHEQGVVHRDIKPGNVMVRSDGHPFVLDFGIAREIQETMTRVTGKLSSGTLLYMSPEQLRGHGPKPAQDVYSFAVMAYECLKGEPPFTRGQIEFQIINEQPESLAGRDGISASLVEGVMSALAKKPEDRPATCMEVLERHVSRRAAEARSSRDPCCRNVDTHEHSAGVKTSNSVYVNDCKNDPKQAAIKARIEAKIREKHISELPDANGFAERKRVLADDMLCAEMYFDYGAWTDAATMFSRYSVSCDALLAKKAESRPATRMTVLEGNGSLRAAEAHSSGRVADGGYVANHGRARRACAPSPAYASVGKRLGILTILVALVGGGYYGWQKHYEMRQAAKAEDARLANEAYQLNAIYEARCKEREKAAAEKEAARWMAEVAEAERQRIAEEKARLDKERAESQDRCEKSKADKRARQVRTKNEALKSLPKHGDVKTLTLANGVTMDMIYVASGEFMMGSDNDDNHSEDEEKISLGKHKVRITQGFWLGRYEVTQTQWQSVMDENPSCFKSGNRPVENVSWENCQKFIAKVNDMVRRQFGGDARLPTEAEWEFACRAGTDTTLPNGENLVVLGDNNGRGLNSIAWYGGNSCDNFELSNGVDCTRWSEKEFNGSTAGTHPVGTKAANRWGFHDMIGNVYEWCNDWYDSSYYAHSPTNDPQGAASGFFRVVRGGSWFSDARHCRSASRFWFYPGYRDNNFGFRLCCSAGS